MASEKSSIMRWLQQFIAMPLKLLIKNYSFKYAGVRATLSHFKRWSRRWKPGERIRVIDWGTGGADIPRALVRWARANGEVIVELWVVHRGGHAWFGGDARGSHTDAQGPDATAAILGFFGLDPQPG